MRWISGLLIALSADALAQQDVAWPLLPADAAGFSAQASDAEQSLLPGRFYYHYLNQQYQDAFNTLTTIRDTLSPPAQANADLLETTLLLALGMEDEALERFRMFSERGVPAPADAWFYLARRWFAAGFWQLSDEALVNAFNNAVPLNPAYRQEALFMQVSALIELDRTDEAARIISGMEDTGLWAGMARHNMLLGRIRQYAPVFEIERLVEAAVYYLPAKGEGADLRDRVRLLAGIYSLESGRFKEAERYLQDASLTSAYTAPALLQFGWARMEQFKYEQALQPWRVLQQQFEPWHPAVIESVLAVPYSLELMNATTQALRSYEHVEQRLQTMLDELSGLQQDKEILAWLNDWSARQQGGWGWSRHETNDPADSAMSRSLMALLADSAFQQQLSQLHDLQRMQSDLHRQQQEMRLWQDMLKQRREAFVRADAASRLQSLQQQRDALMIRVQALQLRWQEEDQRLFSYASGQDQVLLDHLDRVIPRITLLQRINTPTRDLAPYKERWRRARGVLLWRMYEQQPERRWESEQNFWQLQQELAALEEQLNNSQLALQWSGSRWEGLDPRIDEQQKAAAQLLIQIGQLHARQEQELTKEIRTHLQQLHERLTHYQAQARLSIARLYDDALQQHMSAAIPEEIPAPVMEGEQP